MQTSSNRLWPAFAMKGSLECTSSNPEPAQRLRYSRERPFKKDQARKQQIPPWLRASFAVNGSLEGTCMQTEAKKFLFCSGIFPGQTV